MSDVWITVIVNLAAFGNITSGLKAVSSSEHCHRQSNCTWILYAVCHFASEQPSTGGLVCLDHVR